LRDLAKRYSVGRAVIREAIGLLERRGLGSLRPGPSGGFIVKMPQVDALGEELADHFRAVGLSLSQLLDAREAVDLMIVRLATQARPSSMALGRLELATDADDIHGHLALRSELARLTREPAVMPFVKCLNALTMDFAADNPETSGYPASVPLATADLRRALAQGDGDDATAAFGGLHGDLFRLLRPRDTVAEPHVEETARTSDERTLAALVARRLASDIMQNGSAGQRLGSEWDLCERFSVSRLTLRQAIRLLQDSGLVECRRGRGNGLVVRNSRVTGTIRLLLAYLIGQQMDVRSAGTILFQLNCFMPALAVNRADAEQRAKLEELLLRVEQGDVLERFDLLNFVHFVSRVADNPVIDLFSRCLAAYEARFHPFLAERLPVTLQASYFRLMRQLLDHAGSGSGMDLARMKEEAARVMLEMSRSRPI
ncbi:MAG TPA: GntR family transcriptional regulator, partial [Sphingomonadaceae bacterium]|nr:GntR family transcriptional regulator [Sphingomonadaceae bacterium]